MKGFFSRLIQQTGIAIADAPAQSFVQQDDTIPQIHVDEEKVIDNPQETMKEKNSEDYWEISEISSQISENEDIQHPVEEKVRNEESREQRDGEPEDKNVTISDKKAQSIAGRNQPERKINDRLKVEVENGIASKIRQSEDQENDESIAFRSGIGSHNQIIQKHQAYLKEIREWVAGTVPVENEETKSKAAIETVEQKKRINDAGDIVSPYQIPQQRPDNDIHLSIGTISVTVEEPQKKESQLVIKAESSSVKDDGASRLSRHYIRT